MIKIIKDKDLIWDAENFDVVLVGTSIYCTLGNGFQSKLRLKYPIIEKENDKTPYGDYRKLGKRLTISNKNMPTISLMYICDRGKYNRTVIDYEALENCLRTANVEFENKSVVTTVLGASSFDGNGDKEKCLEIIEKCTPNLDLTIYDYEQLSTNEEKKIYIKYLRELEHINKEEYKKLKKDFKNYLIKNYLY